MVLGRKANIFLGKTKKTKNKKTFLGNYAAKVQNDGFLVFPRKKLVFLPKTIFSLGNTGLGRKTIFVLGKRWFWHGNQFFPREKVGFLHQNNPFPRKKLVFHAKTTYFLGKHLFSCPKPFFS